MVERSWIATVATTAVASSADAAPELPPPTKAALQMALLGIALVGLLLVVIVLLGGHWVRRQGALRRGPSVPPDRMPLRRSELPEARGDHTSAERGNTDGSPDDT